MLPPRRPDQNSGTVETTGGLGAGFPSSKTFRRIVIVGSGGLLLVYSPTAAAGNLIASIAGAAGTDSFGNAYVQGITSYQSPGVGVAAGFRSGQVNLYSGPVSGAGPWTAQGSFALAAGGPAVVLGANNGTLGLTSGGTSPSQLGTTIDGQTYGGQTVWIPSGSTETYSSTTLTTSTNLTTTGLFSQGIYQFHLNVVYAGAATNGGLKWSVATDGTGAATMIYAGATGAQVTNADQFPLSGHAAETIGTGFGNALGLTIDGVLFLPVASTGAVAMQFAQNAASATATTLFNGTYMRLWRIG